MAAMDNLKKKAIDMRDALQYGFSGGDIGAGAPALARLGAGISGLRQRLSGASPTQFFQSLATGIQTASNSMQRFGGTLKNTFKTMIGWNTVFGRVTMGMLTWQAWRTVAHGFEQIADSIVGANMRLQSAEQMFTALSGGSEEMGGRYISIIRRLAVETGTSVDKLLENAKRLPTQVGQNFEAFGELTRKAIVLGFLDPVQGVEGAMFALSNFMEGTAAGARSLVQRFELFNTSMVKRAFEEAANPVEALDILFKEAGIDVDILIDKLSNTLPVALEGLNSMFREFFRIVGEPFMDKVTQEVIKLRDWVQDNQPQLQGLGQAFGEGVGRGFDRAKAFVADVFNLDQFNAETWFDAGLELMINLTDGMFTALTEYVIPGITQIASIIGGFFIGASPPPSGPLSEIKEGGKNTLKAYVEGLVEGLDSASIEKLAADILQNIIDIEGQISLQEKSVSELERWVEEAGDAVDAKRREIKLFELETEDIPERFTRARRRQLELELLAAQDEQKRRKDALDIAKAQLKATKEYLRTQEGILRTLERQQKIREKEEKAAEEGKRIDTGFKEFGGMDSGALEEQVAKWKSIFNEKLQPLFDEWKQGLGDLGDFVRGFIGADPDKLRGVTEMFEQGATLRQGIDSIIAGLTTLGEKISWVMSSASENWEKLPPGLRQLIMGIVTAVVFPKVALVAGLTLELADPGNIKGIFLSLMGLFGVGMGGSLISGAGKVVGLVIPLVFRVAIAPVGKAAAWLIGSAAAGLAGAGAAGIAIPVAILVGLILWKGKDLLTTMLEIGTVLRLTGIKGLEWLKEQLEKIGIEIFPETDFEAQAIDIAQQAAGAVEKLERDFKNPWEYMWDTIQKKVEDTAPQIDAAAEEALYASPVGWAEAAYDETVRRSIVPDMMNAIVKEYRMLPERLRPHLEHLYSIIIRTMEMVSFEWNQKWMEMAMTAQTSIFAISESYMQLESMLQEIQYQNQQLQYQQAQSAASGTQAAVGAIAATAGGQTNINLELDADETRRLMEEGTYNAISGVFE
jgi:hypothetical protein